MPQRRQQPSRRFVPTRGARRSAIARRPRREGGAELTARTVVGLVRADRVIAAGRERVRAVRHEVEGGAEASGVTLGERLELRLDWGLRWLGHGRSPPSPVGDRPTPHPKSGELLSFSHEPEEGDDQVGCPGPSDLLDRNFSVPTECGLGSRATNFESRTTARRTLHPLKSREKKSGRWTFCPISTSPFRISRRGSSAPTMEASKSSTCRAYLNEFTFRFNRRQTPMAAFQTVLRLDRRAEGANLRWLIRNRQGR